MPRIQYGKYNVTFNDFIGPYELGETSMASVDYTGDDISSLAEEVIASDPNFPMNFKPINNGDIVGIFTAADDDDYVIAAMYVA